MTYSLDLKKFFNTIIGRMIEYTQWGKSFLMEHSYFHLVVSSSTGLFILIDPYIIQEVSEFFFENAAYENQMRMLLQKSFYLKLQFGIILHISWICLITGRSFIFVCIPILECTYFQFSSFH